MATAKRIDLKSLFKPVSGKGDKKTRLESLIDEGTWQIRLIDAMEKGEKTLTGKVKGKTAQVPAKIVAQRDWFIENGDGTYNVKIGRANYALSGNPKERMVVQDREQLRAVIQQIVDDAQNDKDFQKFINEYEPPKSA